MAAGGSGSGGRRQQRQQQLAAAAAVAAAVKQQMSSHCTCVGGGRQFSAVVASNFSPAARPTTCPAGLVDSKDLDDDSEWRQPCQAHRMLCLQAAAESASARPACLRAGSHPHQSSAVSRCTCCRPLLPARSLESSPPNLALLSSANLPSYITNGSTIYQPPLSDDGRYDWEDKDPEGYGALCAAKNCAAPTHCHVLVRWAQRTVEMCLPEPHLALRQLPAVAIALHSGSPTGCCTLPTTICNCNT